MSKGYLLIAYALMFSAIGLKYMYVVRVKSEVEQVLVINGLRH